MAVKKEGVTYDEIVRSVRAGNFAPVYYLMGEEAYYRQGERVYRRHGVKGGREGF